MTTINEDAERPTSAAAGELPAKSRVLLDHISYNSSIIEKAIDDYARETVRAALSTASSAQAGPSVATKLAEHVLHMDMVTEKGRRARELARQVLRGHDEVLRLLDLIVHATAPTPDDGGGHENAHDLAVEAIAALRGVPSAAEAQGEAVADTFNDEYCQALAARGWQRVVCGVCGCDGAVAYPRPAPPPSAAQADHLQRALHDICEEWAGAECGQPVYAQEAYAIGLAKRMYQLAADALARHPQAVPTTGGARDER